MPKTNSFFENKMDLIEDFSKDENFMRDKGMMPT